MQNDIKYINEFTNHDDKPLYVIEFDNQSLKQYGKYVIDAVKTPNISENISIIKNSSNNIENIIELLNNCTTEYALIVNNNCIVVNDLTNEFIEKYNNFNKDIVFSSTTKPVPKVVVESLNEIKSIQGFSRYLNSGICFGKRNSLIEFYKKCLLNKSPECDDINHIVRKTRLSNLDKISIDYSCTLFKMCNIDDTIFSAIDAPNMISDNTIIKYYNFMYRI